MYYGLSTDDFGRLLSLVNRIATERSCDVSEAVEVIERTTLAGIRPLHAFADAVRRVRARRVEVLGTLPFRDPVWDMLLDLYVAYSRGNQVSVSALCYGAGVPPTTALRHLDRLERLGYVRREPDASDSRRSFVSLSPAAVAPIERLLSAALGHG